MVIVAACCHGTLTSQSAAAAPVGNALTYDGTNSLTADDGTTILVWS